MSFIIPSGSLEAGLCVGIGCPYLVGDGVGMEHLFTTYGGLVGGGLAYSE